MDPDGSDSDGRALRDVLHKRADVFRAIEASPASKPELVERLSSSRSTVDRAIADLTDADCVESRSGTYSLTATGRFALAERDRYAAATRTVEAASDLLNDLPEGTTLPSVFLEGATVSVADPHAPSSASTASSRLLERATAMRGLAPTVLKSDVFIIDRELDREDLEVSIVAEPAVVEALSELSDTPVATLLARDSFDLYRSAGSLPYALWVMETPDADHAGITFRGTGDVTGLVTNDSPDAIAWANAELASYRERASPVDQPV
jgi:predicted transcriptional regulator